MIKGFVFKVWLCCILVSPFILYIIAVLSGKPSSVENAIKFYILVICVSVAYSMPSLLVFSLAVPHLKKLQASTLEKTMLASAITILLIQGTFQLFRAGLEIFFHHITLTYIVVTITAINYFNNDLEKREDA
jgi:hypothetical protein